MEKWDVIILGAGAAGMFCAAESARLGRKVLLVDHADKPGEKIRISGGGRCNFTNTNTSAERFLSQNQRFALSALKRFTPRDFIARVDAARIAWHEKALGQLFCDGPATQIVSMLRADLDRTGVTLRAGCAVAGVARAGTGFVVETAAGPQAAPRVVVATGGKSIPKIGASGFGLQLAAQFGLNVVETRPGLVPLTFATQELDWMRPLAGVSLPVRMRAETGPGFDEAALFTHRGLSGPAVLQVSSFWREGQSVRIDLCPGRDILAELKAARASQGKAALRTVLARLVPERLARHLAEISGQDRPIGALSDAVLTGLVRQLHDWQLTPVGSEGYRTAEVMVGGVDTAGLDGRTMEAKSVPGLHFIGEVVDVTGWLGGYNFQWAWSSAWAAAQAL